MNRNVALAILLSMLFSTVLLSCSPQAQVTEQIQNTVLIETNEKDEIQEQLEQFDQSAVLVNDVRIVVDGKIYICDAKLYQNNWYITSNDVETILGFSKAPEMGDYINLRELAKNADINYEHDDVLSAAYTGQIYPMKWMIIPVGSVLVLFRRIYRLTPIDKLRVLNIEVCFPIWLIALTLIR